MTIFRDEAERIRMIDLSRNMARFHREREIYSPDTVPLTEFYKETYGTTPKPIPNYREIQKKSDNI
jgi:hypothetical protein